MCEEKKQKEHRMTEYIICFVGINDERVKGVKERKGVCVCVCARERERVREKLRRGDGRSGIMRGARPFEFANETAVTHILFL